MQIMRRCMAARPHWPRQPRKDKGICWIFFGLTQTHRLRLEHGSRARVSLSGAVRAPPRANLHSNPAGHGAPAQCPVTAGALRPGRGRKSRSPGPVPGHSGRPNVPSARCNLRIQIAVTEPEDTEKNHAALHGRQAALAAAAAEEQGDLLDFFWTDSNAPPATRTRKPGPSQPEWRSACAAAGELTLESCRSRGTWAVPRDRRRPAARPGQEVPVTWPGAGAPGPRAPEWRPGDPWPAGGAGR